MIARAHASGPFSLLDSFFPSAETSASFRIFRMSASFASSDIKTAEVASFFRSGGIYLGANVANAALIFPLVPILTRHLHSADYGITAAFAISQIHGAAPFLESFLHHHPWRTGRVGRVEIPDSSQEGCDGSAGGLALPFPFETFCAARPAPKGFGRNLFFPDLIAKRGRAPPPAAPRQRLEFKMLRGRRMFFDRGWTPPRLTRGFGGPSGPLTSSRVNPYVSPFPGGETCA